MKSKNVILLALGLLSVVACKPPPAPPPVTVFVKVVDEAKGPVTGAEITAQSQLITKTNPEGRAELTVGGREGASFMVEVRCPPGYKLAGGPLEIRRLDNGGAPPPEYITRCMRMRHTLVVDIAATNGPNLPVLHLGKEVARTDANGKAQITLEGDVGDRIDLQLDTSAKELAKVHPQNPVGSFEIPLQDGTTTYAVKFVSDPKPKAKVFRPSGPRAM